MSLTITNRRIYPIEEVVYNGLVGISIGGGGESNVNMSDYLQLSGGTMTGSLILDGDPTTNLEAATKQYVDAAVAPSSWDFFLTDSAADVSGYYYMEELETGASLSELTTPTLSAGDDQLLWSFITKSGLPNLTFIALGVYVSNLYLRKSGNKTVNCYWKLYQRDTGGTETLLMTSETSDDLIDTRKQYILSSTQNADMDMDETDRLVFKLYANVSGSGNDPTVTISMENNYDSRIAIQVASSAFANIFLSITDFETWRSDVTQTEMDYLHGVTSDIQTQITARAVISGTPVDNQVAVWTGANAIEGNSNLIFNESSLRIGSISTVYTLLVNDGTYRMQLENVTGGWARGLGAWDGTTKLMDIAIFGNDTPSVIYAYVGKEFNDTSARFYPDGAAELYYNNSKKLETTSSGITVIGEAIENQAEHPDFTSGWQGSNWQITADGYAEFDNMKIRGGLEVYEMIINRIRYQNGGLIIGPGGGKIASVSGSAPDEVITFEDPAGNSIIPVVTGAIVMIQEVDLNRTTVVKQIVRRVSNISGNDVTLATVGPPDTGEGTVEIEVGDEMVSIGNVSNSDYDSLIYISATDSNNPFIRVLDGVNSWDKFSLGSDTALRVQIGNLNGTYGYTSDIYGFAAGDPGADHIKIDPTNGIRFYDSTTLKAQLSSGEWVLGEVGSGKNNVKITSSLLQLRNNTTAKIQLNSDGSGFLAGSDKIYWDTSGNVTMVGTITAGAGEIGGWSIDSDAIYAGTKHTNDGYATDGITLADDGGFHAKNFYIDNDGDVGIRGKTIIKAYSISNDTLIANDIYTGTSANSWQTLKTITFGDNLENNLIVRVRYEFRAYDGTYMCNFRVLKNGTEVPSLTNSTYNTSWDFDQSDFAVNAGDVLALQAYVNISSANPSYHADVQNFRILGTHTGIVNEVTGSITSN